MPGEAGEFIKSMPLVIIIALVISYFISIFVVPIFASIFVVPIFASIFFRSNTKFDNLNSTYQLTKQIEEMLSTEQSVKDITSYVGGYIPKFYLTAPGSDIEINITGPDRDKLREACKSSVARRFRSIILTTTTKG